MAVPEAFGFFGDGTGAINVNDAIILPGSDADSPQTMTLSAHSLSLSENSSVTAQGAIRVAAIGDAAAEFDLDTGVQSSLEGSLLVFGALGTNSADHLLVQGGTINIIGNQASLGTNTEGALRVTSGDLLIDDGRIESTGGGIEIELTGDAILRNSGSISTTVATSGDSGDIRLTADNLFVDGQGENFPGIFSVVGPGAGDAGNVVVTAAEVISLRGGGRGGGWISTDTQRGGDGGNVLLNARELLMDGGGGGTTISSSSSSTTFLEGAEGADAVRVDGLLSVLKRRPDRLMQMVETLLFRARSLSWKKLQSRPMRRVAPEVRLLLTLPQLFHKAIS